MRIRREQTISSERVLVQMQNSFITETGKVILGKWPEGEMAPVIFDNRYKLYLPVFKEDRPGTPKSQPVHEPVKTRRICQVILLDVPAAVPPMIWNNPDVHEEMTFLDGGGVAHLYRLWYDGWHLLSEGTDYLKTYYTYQVQNCPACAIDLTMDEHVYVITEDSKRPFTYQSENADGVSIYFYNGGVVPHYMGLIQPPPYESIPEDPLNHSIYSYTDMCMAEVLGWGEDIGGTYFLWRAYTEWNATLGPEFVEEFYRTGLGYMLLQGLIKAGSKSVCKSLPYIVKVDCCAKDPSLRPVTMWYEILEGLTCNPDWGLPEISFGTMDFCRAYNSTGWGLYQLWAFAYAGFWMVPEVNKNCGPYIWTIDGYGQLEQSDQWGNDAAEWIPTPGTDPYANPDLLCHPIAVSVKDRCEGEDIIYFDTCAAELKAIEEGAVPYITYETLGMQGGNSQLLEAWFGYPPWTWICDFGEIIYYPEWRPYGDIVSFVAPEVNVGCEHNPTVTCTDCCGVSVSVTFAVNVYTPEASAYNFCTQNVTFCESTPSNPPNPCYTPPQTPDWHQNQFAIDFYWAAWFCNGLLNFEGSSSQLGCCNEPPKGGPECDGSCRWLSCPPGIGGYLDETYQDIRTPDMIANGCCPINPFTGLPF